MELKESYVSEGSIERVTHIKCTNCDGQALIKLVEKWTDIFREWAPIGYVRQDVDFDEEYLEHFAEESEDYAKEEKEKIWDKFSLEIIDEADMPAPFDKYFLPWEKRGTKNEAYGERVCIRGRSETGATVCICFRSGRHSDNYLWAGRFGKWDRFVLYKPSGKEKTMLTYIVTDEYSPKKLGTYIPERYESRLGQFDMNFYLDFDKGDDNYIAVEGTSGCYIPMSGQYFSGRTPLWRIYAGGLTAAKEGDAGYNDFRDIDLSLFKYLDEASKGFFEMLRLNKDSLWNLGLNKEKVRQEREKARQEKMKHMSEEERAAMEKQSSLLDSLDSI